MGRSEELVFGPLGGVGEIGMNLALYGIGRGGKRRWIVVDCGVSFGDEEQLPGIDLILPDIRFLESERKNLEAIVLTHAHEDHFGALIDLWPRLGVPVYATPFSAGLLEAKCAGERNAPKIPIKVVPCGGRITLGPFGVEFIPVSHSIPEAHSLAITTSAGTVIHTGDWKIDPTPVVGPPTAEARFRALGDAGVLALLSDSTNATREGRSPSETEVARSLAELIAASPARVAVTTFASNVGRIRAVADAARAAGREVVLAGRAMERIVQVARETGYLDGVQEFRGADLYARIPPRKVLALCTGSQGEPRAALARIAEGDHPLVSMGRGDSVIFSSRTIPGNEKAVGRIMNGLIAQGIEVITDRTHLVHVSGHPRRDELREMISWVRPRLLVPLHGEPLHLSEHAALGRAAGVPDIITCRNGDLVHLGPGKPGIIDELPSGRLFKDGWILEEERARAVVERRKLAFAGCAFIALALTAKGEMVGDPEVDLVGIPEKEPAGELIADLVYDAVLETFETLPKPRRRDPDAVAESIRRAVRGTVAQVWGKKPMCHVHVLTV
ncbi:MAG: ribonuclease J [Xanthobacteraceae bacterium]|nr:MAG: ribonuclease J [Xanthobacteraceae bacterium]